MPGGGGGKPERGGGGSGPENGNASAEEHPKDDTKPTPSAKEVDNPFGNDDVGPGNGPQASLQIGRLADALKDASKVKELEDATHMTKEQLDLLVKKYEKPKVGAAAKAARWR